MAFRLHPKSAFAPVTVTRRYKLVPQTVNGDSASAGLLANRDVLEVSKTNTSGVHLVGDEKEDVTDRVEHIGREGRGDGNYHQSAKIVAQEILRRKAIPPLKRWG